MKTLHQKLLKELAETCQTQDELKHPHVAAMIKGLRSVLEQIQVCIFIHVFSFVLALGPCIALLSQFCRNLFLVISDRMKNVINLLQYTHVFWGKNCWKCLLFSMYFCGLNLL